MADTQTTTRPAWVLAGVAILMIGALLLVWGQAAAGDCGPAGEGTDDACGQDAAWGDGTADVTVVGW